MAKRVHNYVNYYRCKDAHLSDLINSGPCKQQFKKGVSRRKNQMQTCRRNYFVHTGSTHFDVINEALAQLEQKEKDGREEEHSKYILMHSYIFIKHQSHTDTLELYSKMLPYKRERSVFKQRHEWDGSAVTLMITMETAWCPYQGWRTSFGYQPAIPPAVESNLSLLNEIHQTGQW